jgi:hypothetical protein
MPFSLTLSEKDRSLNVSKSFGDKFILPDLTFTFLGRAGRTMMKGLKGRREDWSSGGPVSLLKLRFALGPARLVPWAGQVHQNFSPKF